MSKDHAISDELREIQPPYPYTLQTWTHLINKVRALEAYSVSVAAERDEYKIQSQHNYTLAVQMQRKIVEALHALND